MGIFFILRSSFFYAEKQTATCWWQQKLTNIRFCLLYKEERWRALFLEGGREILNNVSASVRYGTVWNNLAQLNFFWFQVPRYNNIGIPSCVQSGLFNPSQLMLRIQNY